jgi:hypothetical protein
MNSLLRGSSSNQQLTGVASMAHSPPNGHESLFENQNQVTTSLSVWTLTQGHRTCIDFEQRSINPRIRMNKEGKPRPKEEEGKRELKIFLEFWLLIGLLAGFNLYNYFRGGSKMFLVVGIICVAALIGWALFYLLYVKRRAD